MRYLGLILIIAVVAAGYWFYTRKQPVSAAGTKGKDPVEAKMDEVVAAAEGKMRTVGGELVVVYAEGGIEKYAWSPAAEGELAYAWPVGYPGGTAIVAG